MRALWLISIVSLWGCQALVNPADFKAAESKKTAQSDVSSADPNKIICRRITVASSRVPKKDCRTRAEWSRMEDETQQRMREFEDKSVQQDIEPGR